MKTSTFLGLALGALALCGTAATGLAAGPFSLNFDGPGTTADAYTPEFLRIGYGVFSPSLDEFGDPIPSSDHWQLDLSAGSVPVNDPSTHGFGTAPSPGQALDVRDGPVVLVFDTPFSFENFTVTLDNSTLGDLGNRPIEFYDAANNLLYSAPVDQSIAGYTVNVGALSDVTTVVLPPTAYYDNVAAVPEPTAFIALLGGTGLLLGLRRRRA